MITFITHVRVSPGNAAEFEAVITDMCDNVRENEPGVVYYRFAKSVDDPDTYVVIEVYRDGAALGAHAETEYLKASVPKTSRLIEGGKYDIKQYVSDGDLPIPRRQKPEAQAAPRT
jgi:quinol monooxygenase YgiN